MSKQHEEISQLNEQVVELHAKGQLADALELSRKVYERSREELGDEHLETAASLNNLGSLLRAMGNLDEAKECLQAALIVHRRILGNDHTDTATCLNNLGGLLKSLGDLPGAKSHYEQALEIRQRVLGEHQPETAASLNNLGELLRVTGDFTEARRCFERALEIHRETLGDEHPNTASTLNSLGGLLNAAGDPAAARSCYERALKIYRKTLGDDHPDTATSLNNVGFSLQAAGQLREARRRYEQALQTNRKIFGPRHPRTASSLNNIAAVQRALGDLAGAKMNYELALDIYREVLGEESLEFAQCLNNVGTLIQEMGDLAGARPYVEQSLAIRRQILGDDHPQTADSLNNLSFLLYATGDLLTAKKYFEEVLTVHRRRLGEEHPHTASTLNNLAGVLFAVGDLTGAKEDFEQALAIRRKVLGEEHLDTAQCHNNLGTLLQEAGDFSNAKRHFERALALRRSALGTEHPGVAISLTGLGKLFYAMGDWVESKWHFEKALAIRRQAFGDQHPDTAQSLNNMASLLRETGDLAEARTYFERALNIRSRVLGEEHADTAQTLNNLGTLLYVLGEFDHAKSHFERTLAIRRKIFGEDHRDTALSLSNLGALLYVTEDFLGARRLLEQALDIRRRVIGHTHPETATSMNNVARLYTRTGQFREALSLLAEAAGIQDRLIGQVASIGSDRQRRVYLQQTRTHLCHYLSLVQTHFPQSIVDVKNALDLVLRRKSIAAEALAVQRDAVLGGTYPQFKPQLDEWSNLRMQIAHKTLAGPGSEGKSAHEQILVQWQSRCEKIETQVAAQIPEMNLERRLRNVSHQEVAQALPDNSVLVEFIRYDHADFPTADTVPPEADEQAHTRYIAFILPAKQPDGIWMVSLGNADRIDMLVRRFRAEIGRASSKRSNRDLVGRDSKTDSAIAADAGAQLRAAVIDPLRSALGQRSHLILSPDGELLRLSFGVLPEFGGGLLGDAFPISYVSTGRDVIRFGHDSKHRADHPLVLADPDFDLSGGNSGAQHTDRTEHRIHERSGQSLRFHRLTGTRVEGQQIAKILGVQPWLGADANEGRLKRECRSPRILHIATHGFFLEDQPPEDKAHLRAINLIDGGRFGGSIPENPLLRSGLALAGANAWLRGKTIPDEAEDGLLTAEDVTGLDLLATELVVLSACATGLGEVRTGEGVFGLQRAFVLAGAKTLIMSLWNVPDEATCELMQEFYGRLLSGEGRAEALHNAQLALRRSHPDPFHWGAFVCLGDPGPMSSCSCTRIKASC